jgi:carbohydrate-binding DOMON domain-containing protein
VFTATLQPTLNFTPAVTEIVQPSRTITSTNDVPLGGSVTPAFTQSSTQTFTATSTFTLTPTQTLPPTSTQTATPTDTVPPTETATATETELPPTSAPSLPPTVGPTENPKDYFRLGLVFVLIALAAFSLYFSGVLITKRDPE